MALISCSGSGEGHTDVHDFDSTIFKPSYASGFEIVGAPGRQSTILNVFSPWQGADSVVTSIFLRRNGEDLPSNFYGQVLEQGEAKRIVCMSSTHIAMLDMVGDADRVVGISGKDNVYNPIVRANIENIGEIGYDRNINYEVIMALQPDLVMLYAINGFSELEPKLKEMSIPFVYMADYLENSPLGKAEWMIAAAELTGHRDEALKAFERIPDDYLLMKKQVSELKGKKPVVMLNTPYSDSWLMSPSSSYIARLISDAGGDYVYKSNSSNRTLAIDVEEAYKLASESDVWLNVGTIKSMQQLKNSYPRFSNTPPVANGRVYNTDNRVTPSGGMDYWESGAMHPNLVLRDIIKILHPQLFSDSSFVYYRQLR